MFERVPTTISLNFHQVTELVKRVEFTFKLFPVLTSLRDVLFQQPKTLMGKGTSYEILLSDSTTMVGGTKAFGDS